MSSILLSDFKTQLADGARPNRFWVSIAPVASGPTWDESNMSFLVKSFSIPAKTIGDIVVNYQGMQTKIAGDPTFDDVTMTLHNDVAFIIKGYFEAWMDLIANTGSVKGGTANSGTNERSAPAEYKTQITVQQLGRSGDVLATYVLEGAYPKQMDAIELSHETTDTLEEMSISFAYDTFDVL
jgi:hypothetical protein